MRHVHGLFRAASAAALLVALGSGLSAKADFFSYATTVSVNNVKLNGVPVPVPVGLPGEEAPEPTNQVSFTPGAIPITMSGLASPGGMYDRADARGEGTTIVFGEIQAETLSTSIREGLSFDFTFTLSLTDFNHPSAAGPGTGHGTIEISGMLSGSAGQVGGGRRVMLNNLQSYATNPADGLIEIGGKQYEVSLTMPNGYPGFTPPGTDYTGRFAATIRTVPEPGSLVLMGLGGLMGVVGVVRRRRKAA